MIHRPTLIQTILGIVKESNALSQEDVAWIESILQRNDGQDGIEQLVPVVISCDEYNKKRGKLTLWEDYLKQKEIVQRTETVKSLFYKQKRILVAVPQRRKHPKVDVPNLGNFICPQNFRADVLPVYGLGYAESRQFFVEKALSENVYSHILFVDDDILLPLDAIGRMVNSNELIIGCNYVKRNPLLESTATRIEPDPKIIFNNMTVDPKKDAYDPVDVNCLGLGATLIDVEVFRRIPKPHFEFRWEYNKDGSRKRLLVGEDSNFIQKALMAGMTAKCIPGCVPLHVDFKTGNQYGPEWLVDPSSRRVRKEYEQFYCNFVVDPRELAAPDNDDTFKGSK